MDRPRVEGSPPPPACPRRAGAERRRAAAAGSSAAPGRLALLCLLLAAVRAPCQDLLSVDTTIVLGPGGSAAVTQRLAWSAGEGGMGGFRYGGELFVPRWRLESCRAELPGGERVPLAVGDRGDFAVAVLPGGRRFVGVAVFQLSFDCDLAATGQYRARAAPGGRSETLIDLSPLAWDHALESRVVRIVLPRRVGGERLDSAELASLAAAQARLDSPRGEGATLEWRGAAIPGGGYLLCCLIREAPAPALSAPRLRLRIPLAWIEPHPAARWH